MKEDYNLSLDFVRSLPTVLHSPHTSFSKDSESIDLILFSVYLDKAILKATLTKLTIPSQIQLSQSQKFQISKAYIIQANFLHESSSPFIS